MLEWNRIRSLREKRKLTQQAAADLAGVSRQRWNDIEHGRKPNVEVQTLDLLAKALGVHPCDLLTPKPARPRRHK